MKRRERDLHTGAIHRGACLIARLEPGAEAGAEALTTLLPDLDEARPGDPDGAAAGLAPSS